MAVFLLAGCSTDSSDIPFIGGEARPFVGGVIADEPRAVKVGQGILTEGGSAADAAVAMYFALSVTYPNAASLGGGGACVAFDAEGKRMESLTFPAVEPSSGGKIAVPGNLRGMVALHARHGNMRWSKLVSPAENLARFGFPMSRALARVVRDEGPQLMADAGTARYAVDLDGRPLEEGDKISNPALAEFLSKIRANPFGITSEMLRELALGAQAAGGGLSTEDLQRNGAEWRQARVIPWSALNIGMPDTLGAQKMQRMWEEMDEGETFIDASLTERPAVLAKGMQKHFAQQNAAQAGSREYGSTGFVAMDSKGAGVACSVTMGQPFGARVSAPGNGVIFALAPQGEHGYQNELVPMVGVNRPFLAIRKSTATLYFLAAGTVEPSSGPNQLSTVVPLFEEKIAIDQAMALPRIRVEKSYMAFESGMPGPTIAALRSQFSYANSVDRIGRINIVHCPDGYKSGDAASCRFRVDPRSFGLAARSD